MFLKKGVFRFLIKCPTIHLSFSKLEARERAKDQAALASSAADGTCVFRFLIKCPTSPSEFYKQEVPVSGKRQKL